MKEVERILKAPGVLILEDSWCFTLEEAEKVLGLPDVLFVEEFERILSGNLGFFVSAEIYMYWA